MTQKLNETVNFLIEKGFLKAEVGIVLGTGLGGLIKEIDIVPSGKKLWQPGSNRPLEKVDITPEMRQRGFVPVGTLTIGTGNGHRTFKNAQGCFLKKFETSRQKGVPVFHKSGGLLRRIHRDGRVTQ